MRLESDRKAIEVDKAELEQKMKNVVEVNADLLSYKLHKEQNQTLYIMSTKTYMTQGAYKVGITERRYSIVWVRSIRLVCRAMIW